MNKFGQFYRLKRSNQALLSRVRTAWAQTFDLFLSTCVYRPNRQLKKLERASLFSVGFCSGRFRWNICPTQFQFLFFARIPLAKYQLHHKYCEKQTALLEEKAKLVLRKSSAKSLAALGSLDGPEESVTPKESFGVGAFCIHTCLHLCGRLDLHHGLLRIGRSRRREKRIHRAIVELVESGGWCYQGNERNYLWRIENSVCLC